MLKGNNVRGAEINKIILYMVIILLFRVSSLRQRKTRYMCVEHFFAIPQRFQLFKWDMKQIWALRQRWVLQSDSNGWWWMGRGAAGWKSRQKPQWPHFCQEIAGLKGSHINPLMRPYKAGYFLEGNVALGGGGGHRFPWWNTSVWGQLRWLEIFWSKEFRIPCFNISSSKKKEMGHLSHCFP